MTRRTIDPIVVIEIASNRRPIFNVINQIIAKGKFENASGSFGQSFSIVIESVVVVKFQILVLVGEILKVHFLD
jgi:hypothetical protein